MSVPTLIVLIGIPASGKSTAAKRLENEGCIVLSSDEIRDKIYGAVFPTDEKESAKLNSTIFNKIKRDAKDHLTSGKSVAVDATNLNRKKRMKLLSYLENIPCYKKAMIFITSMEVCKARNSRRDEKKRVPDKDMMRLMSSFETPVTGEGWDEIIPVIDSEKYEFPFELLADFNQDNPHHTLTLGEHMAAAEEYAKAHEYSERLIKMCKLHDIGKLYTKVFQNYKGEPSRIAHYYGHENLGAYLYLTMELCGKDRNENEIKEILYEAALINCHMRPLTAWKDSLTAKERDKALFGEDFVSDIEKINAADRTAH